LPNGAFNGKTYELHSLVTDSRLTAEAGPYLAVAGDRPASETEGKRQLDIVGNAFANLPAVPNKAVITSRFREFKADFPIEVSGMEHEEAEALISQAAASLNIEDLIGKDQRDQIIEESDGHPYVIKIILGEIANTGRFGKPSNMIVRKEDILDALFERTYVNLSPMANRVFLTLSGWRSLVPQLAVEAVLMRHGSDGVNPGTAVDELVRMSLVERTRAEDETDFLAVPLTAAMFGKKKLEVSPHRELIENDIRLLQEIGATSAPA
jgi:hypothetical protein